MSIDFGFEKIEKGSKIEPGSFIYFCVEQDMPYTVRAEFSHFDACGTLWAKSPSGALYAFNTDYCWVKTNQEPDDSST